VLCPEDGQPSSDSGGHLEPLASKASRTRRCLCAVRLFHLGQEASTVSAPRMKQVRNVDMRHFLLEQTLLAARVDDRRTRLERVFIRELADALHVAEPELHRLKLEMTEFYARQR